MSESSAAIGLASASAALPPPNNSASRLEMNDQVTASVMPRAASARLASRVRSWIGGEHRLAGVGAARKRRRRHALDADDAHQLLDDVGAALHVRPPRRHRDFDLLALAGGEEAELLQHAAHFGERQFEAGQPRQFAQREIDDLFLRRRIAGNDDLGRLAAAQIEHHLRRQLEPGQHEIRIDAALEAIARVGIDAELAPGLRDVDLVPQRRLDQHVGGRLRAAGRLAAHDAGERLDALLVGDHAHAPGRARRSCRRARAGSRRSRRGAP